MEIINEKTQENDVAVDFYSTVKAQAEKNLENIRKPVILEDMLEQCEKALEEAFNEYSKSGKTDILKRIQAEILPAMIRTAEELDAIQ